jgi:DNA-binding response OmpR family regulator
MMRQANGTRAEAVLLKGSTILVADDEFLIGADIEASLREAGADVIGPFMTLKTAVEAARTQVFDAAILDIRLGRDTTESLAELIAAQDIPFIFYSGQKFDLDFPDGFLGSKILSKPKSAQVLIATILDLVKRKRGQ